MELLVPTNLFDSDLVLEIGDLPGLLHVILFSLVAHVQVAHAPWIFLHTMCTLCL